MLHAHSWLQTLRGGWAAVERGMWSDVVIGETSWLADMVNVWEAKAKRGEGEQNLQKSGLPNSGKK